MAEEKKCTCGKTKNSAGNCDGSHAVKKEISYNQITIRCISTKGEPQRVKFLFPDIANNKHLVKTMEFVISDPNYDAKMTAFKAKKPFSENGQTKEAVKESFASPIPEIKTEPKEPQPKNEIKTPVLIGEEKVKRIRRTKAQIAIDNKKLQKA